MPSDLLESEMFGYERGAFTGAVRSKPGKFELCHGGTILLDEIGEMPPALQAKLLHVLQDQEFTRLGGSSKVKVDVRILSATNVNIKSALSAKTFREDLYYRLSTFVFFVPPLRERREDIPLLLDRYVALYGARYGVPCRPLSAGLLARCLRYDWPGNVRELENFAKRYLILGDDAFPSKNHAQNANDCASAVPNSTSNANPICEDLNSHVRNLKGEAEITAIGTALKQTNWNRKQAARVLNISYKSLLGKIQRYGIGYQPSSE
jgi:transcriptional regulator with GAF, ATPase, and Fis domain